VLRELDVTAGFELDPAFRSRAGVPRGDHVLYAGPTTRTDEVKTLLTVAARSRDAWPVCFMGAGRAQRTIAARAHRLRIVHRVSQRPPIRDRAALARIYMRAACVVAPLGGLEAIEAAACGARVVVVRGSAAAEVAAELCETFEPGDPSSLAGAIARARGAPRDHAAAARIVWRHMRARALT
jgi:glycosyltransferase involved in cell wall biosynthesis